VNKDNWLIFGWHVLIVPEIALFFNPISMLLLVHKEECPYCLKVRQYMSDNDISYVSLVSKTGAKSRGVLEAIGGKPQVPFLIDFDEGKYMYESDSFF